MLTVENGTLSSAVSCAHSSGDTARIVKYAANSAAKNISSEESQTIVPTLTMLGRSWCPCSRDAGITAVDVATGAIMSVTRPTWHPDPLPAASCSSHRPRTGRTPDGCLLWSGCWHDCRRRRVERSCRRSTCPGSSPSGALIPFLDVVTVWVAGAYLSASGCCAPGATRGRWAGRSASSSSGWARSTSSPRRGSRPTTRPCSACTWCSTWSLSMLVPLALALGAPGHAGAAGAPAPPARRGCWRCCTRGCVKVLSFPPLTFALFVLSPWLLYFTSWYDASLRVGVRPRDDARPPRARRVAVPVAAGRGGPGARARRLPVPDADDGDDAAVPRVPRASRSWARTSCIAGEWYTSLPLAWLPRPGGRPAPRRRDPVGDRRHRRGRLLPRALRPVGALVDAGGRAGGPAARPAGTARADGGAAPSEGTE